MFTDWFNRKYKEWRGEQLGQDVSASAFARYIGLSQQNVNSYLLKSIPRDPKIINLLAEKLGSDVYREIGFQITPEHELVIEINRLPSVLYPVLTKQIRELHANYIAQKFPHRDNPDRQDE